jgi:DNA-binding NtrC family response regulator
VVLRLVVRIEDRTARHLLAEGDNRVGSGADNAIPIAHPTVSKRHAVIRVAGGAIALEDLGSRNGTRVGEQPIAGPCALSVGETLHFGSVAATLEDVPRDDVEPAVRLSAGPRVEPERDRPPGSTAGQGSLRAFTLDALPALLRQLADQAGPARMAQAAGAALFEALPCASVELVSAERGGVLFTARREELSERFSLAESANDRVKVRVAFVHESFAKAFAPLLETAALLVSLADRRGPQPRSSPPASPPLPEPASLAPRVRAIYADAARVAAGDVSVLILGESGTGKELLARYLHAASARAARPFVALNCAALPGDLLEAELFGIEQAVATGVDARPGKFELADGGTLFLDEIGDMARETQAKILRVLQEGEVYRLGARSPRSARVRVVAATNRELAALREEALRRDLYHRIADWTVELPPLRERCVDIPNLAAHFLAREAQRRGLRAEGISRRALELLVEYPWPGNVRELEREMARATLFLEEGQLLESAHLRLPARPATGPRSLEGTLAEVERREILAALQEHGADVAAAASSLGLGRSTLYRRMRALGLEPGRSA